MKLFFHGEPNAPPGSVSYTYVDSVGQLHYSSEVYFRFGADTNNFYEYRQPINPPTDYESNGWNEVNIVFDRLTAIKQRRSSDSANAVVESPVPGEPGHFYRLKGNPSLTNVKFLQVGVYNTTDPEIPGPVSGQVWVK